MKGHISMIIISNISALVWNDNLYRSPITFKRNLRENFKCFVWVFLLVVFFFSFLIKITVFPLVFSTMPLTKASVSTGHFLPNIVSCEKIMAQKMQRHCILCFGGAHCSHTVEQIISPAFTHDT